MPARASVLEVPTLREATQAYAAAKRLQPSSLDRYLSVLKTHFADWMSKPVTTLKDASFAQHCAEFAQSKGAALVEVGRGLLGALFKYVKAVHAIDIENPFPGLAAAGLMPARAQPRIRKLREADLPAWSQAVEKLPALQRDFLMLIAMTGLRRNEASEIDRQDVDFEQGVLRIPKTKNGKAHSLPITPVMEAILSRRCEAVGGQGPIFQGVAPDHVAQMAQRLGAPKFMLHDLRKMLATAGERLSVSDAALRRILNHTAPRSDVLHRHYVSLDAEAIRASFEGIQLQLARLMAHGVREPASSG